MPTQTGESFKCVVVPRKPAPLPRAIYWQSYGFGLLFGALACIGFGILVVFDSGVTGLCVAIATIIAWPTWKLRHEHKQIANAQRATELGWLYGLGVLTPPFLFAAFFALASSVPEILLFILMGSIFWMIGSAIIAMLMWRIIGFTLPPFVEQDGTLCPHCAYCLLGVQSMRCPECGNAFTYEDLETTEAEFRARSSALQAQQPDAQD